MRPENADLKSMWDMLERARYAVEFTAGITLETYLSDKLRRAALERTIEVLGEAARRVSKEGRDKVPAIAWSAIVATRHIVAHNYDTIDHDNIWRIATVHVPVLIEQLEPFLAAHQPPPSAYKDLGSP
ncbi:hypothetical protein BH11PLA1_BH11PLA1_24280 [soil metagenome]